MHILLLSRAIYLFCYSPTAAGKARRERGRPLLSGARHAAADMLRVAPR